MMHFRTEPTVYIEKRGEGYRAVVELPKGEDGKRKRKTKTLTSNSNRKRKAEAEAFLKELRMKGTIGVIGEGHMDFATLFELWKGSPSAHELSPTTFSMYTSCLEKWVIPVLALYPIHEIRPHMLENYFNSLMEDEKSKKQLLEQQKVDLSHQVYKRSNEENLSYHRSLAVYRSLNHIFKYAVDNKYLDSSPLRKTCKPTVKTKKVENFINEDQVQSIIRYLSGKERQDLVFFLVAVTTGLRRGELAGLAWEDIDFDESSLTVKRAIKKKRRDILHTNKATVIGNPKSKRSAGKVALPKNVLQILEDFYEEEKERRAVAQDMWIKQDHFFVFSTARGTHYSPDTLSSRWRKLMNGYMLHLEERNEQYKSITLHGLRHTAISILLNEGAPLAHVQKHARHAKISTTVDTYGHLTDKVNKEIAEIYDRVIMIAN